MSARARWWLGAGLTAAALLQAGCDVRATQVVVNLRAEPVTAERAAEICIALTRSEGETQTRCGVLGPSGDVELPTRLSVVPGDEDPPLGGFEMRFTVFDRDGALMSTTGFRQAFAECELIEKEHLLDDACIGILCPQPLVCRGGYCVDIRQEVPPEEPVVPGACEADVCWELPRPVSMRPDAACVARDDLGYVVADEWALRAEGERLIAENVGATGEQLRAVECWPDGTVLTGGLGGVVHRRTDDSGWTETTVDVGATITIIWGTDAGEVWVATPSAVFRGSVDTGVAPVDDGGLITPPLRHIAGSSADDVYLVDGTGTLVRFDGTGFEPCVDPGVAIRDIAVATDGAIYLMTDDSRVVRSPSAASFCRDPGSGAIEPASFTALVAATDGSAFAAGSRGELRFWDGAEWRRVGGPPPGGHEYQVLAGRGGSALAASRAHVHWWRAATPTSTEDNLFVAPPSGVFLAVDADPIDSARAIAVGSQGLVWERTATGVWHPVGDGLPTDARWTDVWVGESTTIIVGSGVLASRSSRDEPFTSIAVAGVTFTAIDGELERAVAVGSDGALYERRADSTWEPRLPSGSGPNLTAVALFESRVVVGDVEGNISVLDEPSTTLSALVPSPGPERIDQLVAEDGTLWVLAGSVLYRVVDDGGTPRVEAFHTFGTTNPVIRMAHADGSPVAVATTSSLLVREGDAFMAKSYRANDVAVTGLGELVAVGGAGVVTEGSIVRVAR